MISSAERQARLTQEAEVNAAQDIRIATENHLESGFLARPGLVVIMYEGTINALSQRAATSPSDDYKEWLEFIRVKPDDSIEVGYIRDPNGLFELKPFTLNDVGAAKALVDKLRYFASNV